MKIVLFTIIPLMFILSANARDKDTTIYTTFRLKSTHPDPSSSFEDGAPNYPVFDSGPQFEGGLTGFYRYIAKHIEYPGNAGNNNPPGKVIVEAVIEKDGSIDHPKIIRGVSKDINMEAIRVVCSSPKWKPAVYHGKPVRVKWSFSVNFNPESGNN